MYATDEGIIGNVSSVLKKGVFISQENIEIGTEIVLKARNTYIVDIKIYKNDVVAEFRTNKPLYLLKEKC